MLDKNLFCLIKGMMNTKSSIVDISKGSSENRAGAHSWMQNTGNVLVLGMSGELMGIYCTVKLYNLPL